MKIRERKRITDGRCLKLIISLIGIFMTSWGIGKKELKSIAKGGLGGSAVERLPSAQGVILESQNQVPHQAPYMEPVSPSACVSASLSVCLS